MRGTVESVHSVTIDFFLNDENLQVPNWHIDTDTSIAIIKANSQDFSQGLEIYHLEYVGHTKIKKTKKINIYFIIVY